MATSSMRGLNTFISDLRACRSREQEEKRINKELANIRGKFKEGGLNGYHRKKYVCKLLYIHLLGYDIEFGHVEAVNLITCSKYTEKQIGYVAVTLLLTETSDLVRLVINSIKKDLEDRQEINNCLALQGVANLGGREIAESLINDVFKILASATAGPFARKKSCLCLLRLYRKHPDVIPVQEWAEKIITLLDDFDLGVNLSALGLIIELAGDFPDSFVSAIPKAIYRLYKIIVEKEFTPDFVYYSVPAPWLQIKILSLLRLYPSTIFDRQSRDKLNTCVQAIFGTASEIPKNVQQNNAINAILVEAMLLAQHLDPESDLMTQAASIMSRFLASKETNMRYIGLEMMTPLTYYPGTLAIVKKQQDQILVSLKDKDISVRRRALDLLFSMCDQSNSKVVVDELVRYLNVADYDMREEMILKIAILTEKFATDSFWYLDVILQLITVAGDQVSNEVWYRVVQIITNTPKLHQYAAEQVMNLLKNPSCHESAVKVGSYVLGEFGDLIADKSGCSPRDQFVALHSKFSTSQNSTKCMLLSTFAKFINIFPEIKRECLQILDNHRANLDIELQQRASEYQALAGRDELLQVVFEQMPPFPERESALVQRLRKQIGEDKRSGNIESRSARKAPAVTATAPAADLLGLGSGASVSAPVQSMAPIAVASVPQSKLDAWFEALSRQPNGLLYEDEIIQVGVKSQYQGTQGVLTLFFGNKSSINLQGFDVSVQNVDGLLVTLANTTSVVQAATQMQIVANVECIGLPQQEPRLQIRYQQTCNIQLQLPVLISKFFEPILMNQNDFVARWSQIGAGKESVEILKSAVPIRAPTFKTLFAALNIGVLEGVDPNPNNVIMAFIWHTKVIGKIGLLGRLEVAAEQSTYRLTLRSTNEQALPIVKLSLCQRIAKL